MNKSKLLKILGVISASLVALACIVELFVLIFGEDGTEIPAPQKDPFDAFTETFDLDSVKKITYNVSYTESGITLNGKYTAIFSSENGKRSVTLEYKYDKLNEIGESDEMISTLGGIIAASGEDEIKEVFGDMNIPYGIFIEKECLESYELSDARLTGRLSDGALGEGSRDITLTLDKNTRSKNLSAFELAYTAENGSAVKVKAKLEYKS